MIDIEPDESPVGVQIFGSDPEIISLAVKRLADFSPNLIDINLGCPVRKVVHKNGGAALLKDLSLASEILHAAVENSRIPITVKIRTGWDVTSDVFLELGKIAERAKIASITLHARSRTQSYSVKADWSKIKALKEELSIPVIGNGDITSPADAEKMMNETGCDGVMVARGAMKNLYIFKQIKRYLNTGELLPDLDVAGKIELAIRHSRAVADYYGEEIGTKMMRKHLVWYTKGIRGGSLLRNELMKVSTVDEIKASFDSFLGGEDK